LTALLVRKHHWYLHQSCRLSCST